MKPTETLTSNLYLKMIEGGTASLAAHRKEVNDLNVFPIPDGDTGDNMLLTIRSGLDKGRQCDTDNLGMMAQAISSGMLLGARGNSGVILSRIFAGIAKGLEGVEKADITSFNKAMRCGVEESYGSVSNPVEGTILTVFKDAVKKSFACGCNDFESYFEVAVAEMDASLDRTPDLLPVLKESGVVDSGGAGLLCIAKGMESAINGTVPSYEPEEQAQMVKNSTVNLDSFTEESELEFGYCTEFLLRLQKSKVNLKSFDVNEIITYLNDAGDSVVAFRDGSIVKVHIHTKTPGEILNHCQRWGEFLTLKIENMTLQHHETDIKDNFSKKKQKKYGIVTVASGEGLTNTLKEAGADAVIEGGQTMNPSAESFIEAFDSINAGTVFVFPNNSNIILTARQAADLYEKSKVIVIPTTDIGAGYVAIASMDLSSKDELQMSRDAEATAGEVVTGQVSIAIRDTVKDGIEVKEGDYIGFCSGTVLTDNSDKNEAAVELCGNIGLADHDVALVFYGGDTTVEEAEQLASLLEEKYPRTEIIMNAGGQPVYNYIIVLC